MKFEWRIRNLKYPKECYILEIDDAKQEIVVKTTVKKYYKRFDIPDLKRLGIALDPSNLAYQYQNQTLIIRYDKPKKILELEKKKQGEI